jgi:pimeloyl-ACP methyl ester carboxylesterase
MKPLVFSAVLTATLSSLAQAPSMVTVEHKVRVTSKVPSLAGQSVELYMRERFREGTPAVPPADRVVLFVHGAGTPAEVAFDVPHGDYSWMAHLAKAGFVVYSMDTSGYGRSVRPAPMNDPCNLSPEQQKQFVPALIPAPCAASYPGQLTTIASDWHDIDAVVNHIRSSRKVEKVSLVGWSLGGPRAGGYAAQHPEKVQRLVLLAPAYNRDARSEPPP